MIVYGTKSVMKLLNKRKCRVGTIHIFAVNKKNPLFTEEMKEQLKHIGTWRLNAAHFWQD